MLKIAVSIIVNALALVMFMPSANADCTPSQDESQIWDAVKGSTDALDFASYLREYPAGCFRAVALFKLRSLVPEIVLLTAQIRVAGDGAWYQAGNGGFLTHGDNVVESMKIKANSIDSAKLTISYTCDAAGKGVLFFLPLKRRSTQVIRVRLDMGAGYGYRRLFRNLQNKFEV